MTVNEAIERSQKIWGARRVRFVRDRGDGSFDVECRPAGIASDTRGRNYAAHTIDANGHPLCHADCMVLEEQRCAS